MTGPDVRWGAPDYDEHGNQLNDGYDTNGAEIPLYKDPPMRTPKPMIDPDLAYEIVYKSMGGVRRTPLSQDEVIRFWDVELSSKKPVHESNSLHVYELQYLHKRKRYAVYFEIGSSKPFGIDLLEPMKPPKSATMTAHQKRIHGYQVEINRQPIMVSDLTVEQLQDELCQAIDALEDLDSLVADLRERISKWRSPPPKRKPTRRSRTDPAFGTGGPG